MPRLAAIQFFATPFALERNLQTAGLIRAAAALVKFLRERDLLEHTPYWKLAQALFEVLPRGEDDWKLISALLGERENLRAEGRRGEPPALPGLM